MNKVIVIGGGPAGISATLYARRGGLDVSVILSGESALKKAERIDNYYGFPGGISGSELLDRGTEQARKLEIPLMEEEVVGLEMVADGFSVTTTKESHSADAVILAMGSPRKRPAVKGIEKFEGHGVSYCAVCDGFFFRGKDVAVLGSGDYARHEAEVLRPLASSVILISEEEAEAVEGEETVSGILKKDGSRLEVSGLFVAMGSAGSGELAMKLGAAIDGNRIIVDEDMATNVPGLYAAGDCTGGLLQVAKAVHEGAVAGLSVVRHFKRSE